MSESEKTGIKQTSLFREKKKLEVFVLVLLWFFFGQALMFWVASDAFPSSIHGVSVLASLIPSLGRMELVEYFNLGIAQTYASLMLLCIPILFKALQLADVDKYLTGVRAKGRSNELMVATIFFLVGAVVILSGFDAKGPGQIFRNTAHGFALLSNFLAFMSAFSFRLSINLLYNKNHREE